MTTHRMDFDYKHSWPKFDPINFDCDVEGCQAKKGEYCDSEHHGVHVERALDELERIVRQRSGRRA